MVSTRRVVGTRISAWFPARLDSVVDIVQENDRCRFDLHRGLGLHSQPLSLRRKDRPKMKRYECNLLSGP
jgi:hypothetical protein